MSFLEIMSLFCQVVLLLAFAYAAAQKLRDHGAYERSMEGFALLPMGWVTPLAWLATGAECLTVVLLLAGLLWNGMRLSGVLLALALLLIFTGALISVMVRGLHVPCGCFGANERPVSVISLVRNGGLIACCILATFPTFTATSSVWYRGQALLLTTLVAAAFVMIWSHLDEMIMILRPQTA